MKNITANYHTHTTFCDGKNTPEEVVLSAIEKEFSAIGFSSHGYTDFDLRYCMKDTKGYIAEINRLKVKYKDKIQIYLGLEEDAFCHANRESFDYIIGSSHYFLVDGKYYPIDSSYDYFKKCLELFGYDVMKMTHSYYIAFCDYITKRKPDIVGHFDLITKFDELDTSLFLENREYVEAAKKYIELAADSGCLFEVNTGAISRGYRTSVYPAEDLLYILKKKGAGLVLASDSHSADTLDFGFEEAKHYIKDVGFDGVYCLYDGKFIKEYV
jgi:histidinol-phosphatase (PHP family)